MLARRTLLLAFAAPPPSPILDTHVHFYDPSRPQGVPWPPASDSLLHRTVLPPEFAALTQPLGVSGAIVVEASSWIDDNAWVLELARRHPLIRGLVGRLEPGTPAFPQQLARFRANPLFLGIRVGWNALTENLSRPVFLDHLRRLADANLALDTVGGPLIVPAAARLNDAIPSLRIILDHLPFEKDTPLQSLKARPNIYAKLSNFWNEPNWNEAAHRVFETFSEDRLLYGSNWPVSLRQGPYAENLARAQSFFQQKGPAAAAKYFHDNSRAAYRWPNQ
jgi:L-fuconolactonase